MISWLWVDFALGERRYLIDKHESMAFVCQSLTPAAGTHGTARGGTDESLDMNGLYGFLLDHSAQFGPSIQQTWVFYEKLRDELLFP